jgi:hypothetical protein
LGSGKPIKYEMMSNHNLAINLLFLCVFANFLLAKAHAIISGTLKWFAAASLDDPAIAEPKTHVYVSNQQPWIKLDDGLPTFPEF